MIKPFNFYISLADISVSIFWFSRLMHFWRLSSAKYSFYFSRRLFSSFIFFIRYFSYELLSFVSSSWIFVDMSYICSFLLWFYLDSTLGGGSWYNDFMTLISLSAKALLVFSGFLAYKVNRSIWFMITLLSAFKVLFSSFITKFSWFLAYTIWVNYETLAVFYWLLFSKAASWLFKALISTA